MFYVFKEVIKDYYILFEKIFIRDLIVRISSYISFINECRFIFISMGNVIRFLKICIVKLFLCVFEMDVKVIFCLDIDRYINEKIVIVDKVIVEYVVIKVRDGDVLFIYGVLSVVEMVLLYVYGFGKRFRVVIVDLRLKFEG